MSPGRLFADPVAGLADDLGHAQKDRWTLRLVWTHAVFVLAAALLDAFTVSPFGRQAVDPTLAAGAVGIAFVAAIVPSFHRGRASSPRVWRVAGVAALTVQSYLLVFLTQNGLGSSGHIFLVLFWAAWYGDRTLPFIPLAVAAIVQPVLGVYQPEWIGPPGADLLFHLGRLGFLAVATVLAAAVAEAQRNVVSRGISLRQDAEKTARRFRASEAAARANEERLQTILDTLPEGVLIIDAQGRVTFSNQAAATLLGTTRHELLQRRCNDTAWRLRPDAPGWNGGFPAYEVLRTGKPAERVRCRVVVTERDVRFMEATVVPIVDGSERVTSVVASFVDITERERARVTTDAMRRQIAVNERAQALGSLVSGVFHEIRTPLTYQQNHLYIANTRIDRLAREFPAVAPALEDVKQSLDEVREGATRINHLVANLRRFSRSPDSGRQALAIHDVVAEAFELFRATHRGGVDLHADLSPTLPCRVDPVQVQQVVLNLLENAYEAAGPRGKVRLQTRGARGGAEIVVIDTGPGIPKDVQERIFDEFFTTKPHGTGLGLSIVRRIVQEHGGSIRVESEPGLTRFVVFIPHAPLASTAVEVRA